MHPRLSVSARSSGASTLDEDLALWQALGVRAVGLSMHKLDGGPDELAALADRLAAAGVVVTNLLAVSPFTLDRPEAWPDQRDEMGRIMDAALALRPGVLALATGAAGVLPWERAADALDEVLRGSVREAEREGLVLALEHTDPHRRDLGFVHTLRDAIDLSWRLDTRVCLDVDGCWSERNLAGTIAAAAEQVALVQVSDRALASRAADDRRVPGDGDLPLARVLGQLLEAGYEGPFDLEIGGPAVAEEGVASAVRRSLDHLTELLDELERPPDDEDGDGRPVDAGTATPDGPDGEAEPGGAVPEDLLWQDPFG